MDSIVYAVSDGYCGDYYLVDIGDFEAAKSLLPKGANVRGVFITHGHHDHILGLNKLKAVYPECVVYASEACIPMLFSAKANLSAYMNMPFVYEGEAHVLKDGDSVVLFDGVSLKAISAPGHHPSCMCFLMNDYLFTGDAYIPGVKVVTNLPGGKKMIATETVKRIQTLGEGKTICPGHIVKAAELL